MLKCIIFDLGRVLIPFDFQRGYSLMSERCGLPPEEIRTRIRNLDIVNPYESGQVDTASFVAAVNSALGVSMPVQEFGDMWNAVFLPDTLIPEALLEELKPRHRLVLLSNTNDLHYNMIDARYPILRHFDERVLSYKVGAMKPDPRIYLAAIAAARCAPEECFFTDDVPAYVEGAKKMGIDAVQFESAAQTRRELALRGCLNHREPGLPA
jgi:glucose-1-phosphatase